MDKQSRNDKAGRDGVGVGGRLKQRLAQILLHSCTTTSATTFVSLAKTNAAPATSAASSLHEPPPAAGPCANEPRSKIDGSRRRRRRHSAQALVHISIDCSGVGAAGTISTRRSARSVAAALLPSPMLVAKDVKVKSRARNGNGNKPRSPSYSCSSSTVTDDELAPFSSDGERGEEDAETRSTFFSSLSFSSDSTSDFYKTTGHNSSRSKRHKNPPRRAPRRVPPRGSKPADTFRSVVSAQAKPKHDKADSNKADKDGGVVGAAGSMAVVKRSHNPYADFQSSMVEMVVERRICGAEGMGELLVSYLSLNSPRHHPAILAAFEDVWEAVFVGK